MAYEDLRYEVADGVANVTIDRPERRNALRGQTMEELTRALTAAARDDEVGVVVVTGSGGHFCGGDRELFRPLVESLLTRDEYMLLADYRPYVDCQDRVEAVYRDTERWTRMSIANVARIGYFSSDRAIREYCRDIWHVEPGQPQA